MILWEGTPERERGLYCVMNVFCKVRKPIVYGHGPHEVVFIQVLEFHWVENRSPVCYRC